MSDKIGVGDFKSRKTVDTKDEFIVINDIDDLPEDHDCDVMGCSSIFCIQYRFSKEKQYLASDIDKRIQVYFDFIHNATGFQRAFNSKLALESKSHQDWANKLRNLCFTRLDESFEEILNESS